MLLHYHVHGHLRLSMLKTMLIFFLFNGRIRVGEPVFPGLVMALAYTGPLNHPDLVPSISPHVQSITKAFLLDISLLCSSVPSLFQSAQLYEPPGLPNPQLASLRSIHAIALFRMLVSPCPLSLSNHSSMANKVLQDLTLPYSTPMFSSKQLNAPSQYKTCYSSLPLCYFLCLECASDPYVSY